MAEILKEIVKKLAQREIEVLLSALEMLSKSLERRIVAETDADAKAVWQKKKDEVAVLASKMRLT